MPTPLTPVTTPWTHRGVAAVDEDFPVNAANAAAPTATAQTRMNNAIHSGTATGVVNRDVAELGEFVMVGTVREPTQWHVPAQVRTGTQEARPYGACQVF